MTEQARRGAVLFLFGILVIGLLFACSEQPPPSREHIPILKARLFELQEAIKANNPVAIDSIMSVEALSLGLDSDSLLRFVYGPTGDFPFAQLGNANYFYTHNKARIDCYVMDSTAAMDRPVSLTFILDDELWLLKRFEPGLPELESSDEDQQ
jgi:hypothetical protein